MTDATPPSIPPRQRPTTPVTARASSAATEAAGPWTTSVDASPYGPRPSNGSGGRTATSGSSNGAGGRTATSGQGGTTRDTAAARPESTDRVASGVADPDDGPSPLMVAVDTATVWLKKAAGATSTAFAAVTRPRTEDTRMSTPAPAPAAPPRTSTRPAAGPATGSVPRPTTGQLRAVGPHGAPRRVRLAISRVDPWSVMKLSFLLSVAIGVMIVVAAAVVWLTLDGLHVFTKIDTLVTQVVGNESNIDILQYVEFKRIVSGATLIAVIDVFLLTALATIGAFLYNIVAALVGGVHVTMTDE